MAPKDERLGQVRVCAERCSSCIFGPQPAVGVERRNELMHYWRKHDTFQNCHYGTVTGDRSLMCRGFYDWCEAVGWEPAILQLAERLHEPIRFVPVPTIERGE